MTLALPETRGAVALCRPLAPIAWMRVGGPAEAFFQPADADDLAAFLAALPETVPVATLGACSNLIIRDGGLPGVAIKLGRAFAGIEILDGQRIRVGAAALDARVAARAAEAGIAGLEYLRTIPGTVGGAVKMNAGCYGASTETVFESATAVTRRGEIVTLRRADVDFVYRASRLPDDWVLLDATLRGRPGERAASEALMAEYLRRRAASQPAGQRCCGSAFANPSGHSSTGEEGDPMDLKAWKLIDDAGCRGLSRGGARMSDEHANFLINADGATAADLEDLGEEVRARVKAHSGLTLLWEIKRIGVRVHG